MTKIAILGDTHFGANRNSLRVHQNNEVFYRDVFFPELEKQSVDIVIQLGDLFHDPKKINFLTLQRSKEYFFRPLIKTGIPTYFLVGNHDTYFRDTNKVNAVSSLLPKLKNFHIINDFKRIEVDGKNLDLLSWLNDENTLEGIPELGRDYLFGHLQLEGYETPDGMSADLFTDYEIVFTGHFHNKSIRNNIFYVGTPYQLSWSEFENEKGFHIWDVANDELEFIKNPFDTYKKIVYDAELPEPTSEEYEGCSIKVIVPDEVDEGFENYINKFANIDYLNLQVVVDNRGDDILDDSIDFSEVEDTESILKRSINNLNLPEKQDKIVRGIMNELLQKARA